MGAPAVRVGRGLTAFVAIAMAGLGVQVLTVVSGPLVARMLGPSGRGQMVMVTLVAMLFALAGVGGLPAAISHAVAASGAPARDVLRGLLRWWVLAMLLPATIAAGVTAVVQRHADGVLVLSLLTAAICWFLALQFLFNAMVLGEGHVRRINIQRLVGTASYVLVIALIFVLDPTDHSWVLLAVYAASLCGGFAISWTMMRRPVHDPRVRADPRGIHGFARRGFISGLFALDSLGLDQLLVGVVLGQAALGLYSVAVSVTSVPSLVLAGIGSVLLPRMSALSRHDATTVMRRWIAAAVLLDFAMVVGIEVVLEPALRIFFGSEFVPATPVARILAVAWGLLALRRVLTAAAQAQGRVARASIVEAVATATMLVLVIAGTHLFGLDGAGWAVLFAAAGFCVVLGSSLTWRAGDDERSNAGQTVA